MKYQSQNPSIEEVESTSGRVVIQFGTDWCGYCQGAQPYIENALKSFSDVKHLMIEDGPGRRLGRHFKVKLWPTLILLIDGKEAHRVVRPEGEDEVVNLLKSA